MWILIYGPKCTRSVKLASMPTAVQKTPTKSTAEPQNHSHNSTTNTHTHTHTDRESSGKRWLHFSRLLIARVHMSMPAARSLLELGKLSKISQLVGAPHRSGRPQPQPDRLGAACLAACGSLDWWFVYFDMGNLFAPATIEVDVGVAFSQGINFCQSKFV